jgi:hypothetical protein
VPLLDKDRAAAHQHDDGRRVRRSRSADQCLICRGEFERCPVATGRESALPSSRVVRPFWPRSVSRGDALGTGRCRRHEQFRLRRDILALVFERAAHHDDDGIRVARDTTRLFELGAVGCEHLHVR